MTKNDSPTISTAAEFIFDAYKQQTEYLCRVVTLLGELVDAIAEGKLDMVDIIAGEAKDYLVSQTDLALKYRKDDDNTRHG